MRSTTPPTLLTPPLLLAVLALASCSGNPKPAASADERQAPPPGSPFGSGSSAAELRELTDQLDTQTATRRPTTAAPAPRAIAASRREPQVFPAPGEPDAAAATLAIPGSSVTTPPAPPTTPAATAAPATITPTPPSETPAQRRDRLMRELAATLGDQPEPGSALDQPLRALLLSAPGIGPEDDASAARALEEQALAANSNPGLAITTAALARRVTGFGQYTPFASSAFLVGRAQTVLVYVEVDRFAHREVTEQTANATADAGPLWSVELTQTLHLYHESDGTLAWRAPEQPVTDRSRRQRRDHYLVQRVDLPANLTIGSYQLKVIVRDRVSNAQAERIIPIQIVADPDLATR
jgi:hypothetical protein